MYLQLRHPHHLFWEQFISSGAKCLPFIYLFIFFNFQPTVGANELQQRPAESRDCFKSFWLTVRLLRLKVGGVKLAVMHGHQIQCHCSPSNDSFFCVISIKTTSLTHFRKLHAFIKLDYKQEIWHQDPEGLRSKISFSLRSFWKHEET